MSTPHDTYPATTSTPQELLLERVAIIGNIDTALEALPLRRPIDIGHFGVTHDGQAFGVKAEHLRIAPQSSSPRSGDRNGSDVLSITGVFATTDSTAAATFPMYRVTRTVPTTDSGYLRPHYEISASNPDSPVGYKPVALVMQSILGSATEPKVSGSPRVGGYYDLFKSSVEQLQPAELDQMRETGLYTDPNEQAKLTELQTILGLIAAQAEVDDEQPALPLDFSSAA